MSRHAMLVALLLLAAGCGEKTQAPEAPNKTVPALPFLYEGRSLESWKQVPPGGIEEESIASAFAIAALETKPQESVSQLVALLRDPRPSVRIAAAIAAGRLAAPSEEVAALLVSYLDAPEEPLRRHARVSLGTLGSAAVTALKGALADDRARVRWAALVAAGKIGAAGEALRPLVEQAAHEDPEDALRRQALRSLPHLGTEGLKAALALLESEETQVRLAVASGIARVGGDAVASLAAFLRGEASEVARAEAAAVLADLGPQAAPAIPALLESLREEGVVRFNAADALVAIGKAAVAGLEALESDPDEDLAATAAYALEQIRKP